MNLHTNMHFPGGDFQNASKVRATSGKFTTGFTSIFLDALKMHAVIAGERREELEPVEVG